MLNIIFIVMGFMQPIALIFSSFFNASGISGEEERRGRNYSVAKNIISEHSEHTEQTEEKSETFDINNNELEASAATEKEPSDQS
eukprot:CAMPEP_0197002362 /NCGR_PEP_ID=MMETSP1380-20130617/6869_1 /TAXON_ID=5936 /ORGANISM="Euplotes crassus, Strain CT5" /LENGTH=84 /DNA_ID=CAMNT_0042420445 /DNA_START=258 /DNA_END=508 /DNA_ORIENTATION=-